MNSFDVCVLGCTALVTVAFGVVRRRLAVFAAVAALAVAICAWTSRVASAGAEGQGLLLTVGMGLYGFGLLIVRIMLRRSVSLRFLTAALDGQAHSTMAEDIRTRLNDAAHYRLVRRVGEEYALTFLGRILAGTVAGLYRLARVDQ